MHDHYHFHMMLSQERMTRHDRLEADERLGRAALALSGSRRAAGRRVRGLLRWIRRQPPEPAGACAPAGR